MANDVTVGDIRKAVDAWDKWLQDIRDALTGRGDDEDASPINFPAPPTNPIITDNCDPPIDEQP